MADEMTNEGGLAPISSPVGSPQTDASPHYINRRQQLDFEDRRAKNQALLQAAGVDPVAQQTKQAQEADPTDKHGIAFRVAADVVKGIADAPSQIVGGAEDAVWDTMNNLGSVATWINDNIDSKYQIDPALLKSIGEKVKAGQDAITPDKSESNTGNVIRGISHFMTGFIPILKGVKMATGARGMIGTVLQAEAAAAATGAAVFDPQEARLSNLIEQYPALQNPVTGYLAAKPGDTKAEGALKNALESMGMGAVTESAFQGLRYGLNVLKASRDARGISGTKPLGTPDAPIDTQLGDPNGTFLKQETAQKIMDGSATADDVAAGLNFSQINSVKDIDAAVNRFQKAQGAYDQLKGDRNYEPFDAKSHMPIMVDSASVNVASSEWASVSGKKVQQALDNGGYVAVKLKDGTEARLVTTEDASGAARIQAFDKEGNEIGGLDYSTSPDYKGNRIGVVSSVSPNMRRKGLANAMYDLAEQTGGYLPLATDANQMRSADAQAFHANRIPGQTKFLKPGEVRANVVSDSVVNSLARKMAVTTEDVLGNKMFLKGNRAIDAERMRAVDLLLDATNTKVVELARKAANSTDMADLVALQRMLDKQHGIYQYFQGAGSEVGRALRIRQLPTGSTAKQIAAMTDEIAANGGSVEKLREAAQFLSDKNLIDGEALAKARKLSSGGPVANSVAAYWYFSLLSGAKTHATNVISNSLNLMWQIPERALAAQISKLRGATDGVQEGEAKAMFYGMINSFSDGLRAAGKTLRTGESVDAYGATYTGRGKAISAANYGMAAPEGSPGYTMAKAIDLLGSVIEAPTRLLQSEDEFFKTIARKMEMNAQAVRQAAVFDNLEGKMAAGRIQEILENPPQNILDAAQDFSKDVTFTTPLGDIGSKFQAAINSNPISRAIIPFFKVSTNLIKWTGERTLLAPIAKSIRADIANGGAKADLALAKMAMGTMTSAVFADLAWKGLVTANGPADPTLQANWRIKNQPYSVKLPTPIVEAVDRALTLGAGGLIKQHDDDGMTWVAYNRMDPMGTLLGTAASFGEMAGNMSEDDKASLAGSLVLSLTKTAADKVWTKGVADALEALYGREGSGEKWLQRMAGTLFVPNLFAQVSQTTDPVWRDVDSVADAIRARTQGFSKDLPPHRNVWGDPVHLEGGIGPDIMSPVYTQHDSNDPATNWIINNKVGLAMPARTQSFSTSGAGVELTPQQYSRFTELAGNAAKDPATGKGFHDTVNALMTGGHPQSYQWQQGTDGPEGSRQGMVRKLAQDFRDLAKMKMLEEDPTLRIQQNIADQNKTDLLFKGPKQPTKTGGPTFGP